MTTFPTRRALIGTALLSGGALLTASPLSAAPDPDANPMPAELRRAIERDPASPVLGNAQGDVTLTEFTDYNCPFCRGMLPGVLRLIARDPQLRVVIRETPVFGEGSWFAARAALAAGLQGRYLPMHKALLSLRGRAEEASVLRVARQVGLDLPRLQRDMKGDAVNAQIDASLELFDHMGLAGTPTFIAGNEGVFGRQDEGELAAMIVRARRRRR